MGPGATQGQKTDCWASAVAFFIREWVDVPNAPYEPKVIALKSTLRFLSLMIFLARRSLLLA